MSPLTEPSLFAEVPAASLDLPVEAFLFLRHGRTAHNAQRLVQGFLDVPLDDVGRDEARAAAAHLAANGAPTRIVASDLARAWETAGFVAAATGTPVEPEPGLRERDFGPLGGTAIVPGLWSSVAPGVETIEHFAERIAAAVRRHVIGPDCLLVAHGGVLRVLAHLLGAPIAIDHLANALPLRLERNGAGWQVVALATAPASATYDTA